MRVIAFSLFSVQKDGFEQPTYLDSRQGNSFRHAAISWSGMARKSLRIENIKEE